MLNHRIPDPDEMNRRQFNHRGLCGLAALMAVPALTVSATSAPAAESASTTPQALNRRMAAGEGPAILDVRSREEFAAGHIPGAINLPVTELERRVGELAPYKDAELVVHCEVGPRAGMAARFLGRHGFSNLVELEGHMRAWREAGLPMEK
jgi:hydroxyacylglutathione hydrolase